MIDFEADELLLALAAHARTLRTKARLNREAMLSGLAEARALSHGQPLDEPAALFFAFAPRSSKFGPIGRVFVFSFAHAQALALGYSLDMSDVELTIHEIRILRGEIDFAELRAWFASRLRPIGEKRPPMKRPRDTTG
ncbi:MAG: hypothetical protein IPK82_12380 [Polyangiaceae bacterium]|nr:hypothetical protein [Polyangiaceae bacterium]